LYDSPHSSLIRPKRLDTGLDPEEVKILLEQQRQEKLLKSQRESEKKEQRRQIREKELENLRQINKVNKKQIKDD